MSETVKRFSPESKELTTIDKSIYFQPAVWDQMQRIAQCFNTSGALTPDVQNLPQLMIKLQAGYEMGMQPMESLNSLYIVNGKVSIWGEAMTRRLRKFGYKIKWVESDEKKCTVEVESPDGEKYQETYTMKEADDSGISKDKYNKKKFAYDKFPVEKLRWNAIRRLIKFNCPEVLDGFEIKEVQDDFKDVIEAEVVDSQEVSKKDEKINKNDKKTKKSEEISQKVEESEQEPSFDDFKKNKKEEQVEEIKEESKKKEETPEEKKKREQEEIAKTIASNPEVLNV